MFYLNLFKLSCIAVFLNGYHAKKITTQMLQEDISHEVDRQLLDLFEENSEEDDEMYDLLDDEIEPIVKRIWKRRRSTVRKALCKLRSITKKPHEVCEDVVVNGCGPQSLPSLYVPYKETLSPTCDKHDVCYTCFEYYGWTREECDKRFKKDMYLACDCNVSSYLQNTQCKRLANYFYMLVNYFGKSSLAKKPASWCACAESRGSVYHSY